MVGIGGRMNVAVENQQPLHMACRQGFDDVIMLLIDKGADVNAVHGYDKTPLFYACQNGHFSTVRLLIENGARVDFRGAQGAAFLIAALESGHSDVVRFLIENEADVNARGDNELSPLFLASKMGHEPLAQLLVDRGADVHTRDREGRTPLFSAAHPGIANLLIKRGAEVNAKDEQGNTPLLIVAGGFHVESRSFSDEGADVSCGNESSNPPPLMTKCEPVAKLLIEKGADINVKNSIGITPISLALMRRGGKEASKASPRARSRLQRVNRVRRQITCWTPSGTWTNIS
jgi:ankyrin repeat protein